MFAANSAAHYPVRNPFAPAHGGEREVSRSAHIARIEAALLRGAHDTLDDAGFTQVVASTLTGLSGACGEPGTLISVRVGDGDAYLRQTSQLHLEPLMRELGAVYSIGRSFRAERRQSARHLTEFTLIEAEAAGWSLDEMMGLMERLVAGMLRRAALSAPRSLEALGSRPQELAGLATPFARMTYDQAVVALQRAGWFIEWGEDFTNEQEIALADMVGGPLFVTHYPVELRFFTMKVCRHDPRVVECCDLLMPGMGEVMGASETEADPALLHRKLEGSRGVKQLVDLGGSASGYDWYVEMHREGSGLQSGFGMGFERLVRYACGLASVHDTVVAR